MMICNYFHFQKYKPLAILFIIKMLKKTDTKNLYLLKFLTSKIVYLALNSYLLLLVWCLL